jgi:hypothetical protein
LIGSRSFGMDDNQHLPPWLRGLPLPPRPAVTPPAPAEQALPPWSAAAAPVPDEPAENIPDWLRALGGAAESLPSDAQPSSNNDLPEAPPSAPQDDDLPEWLRDLRAEVGPPADEPIPLPDWLHGAPSAAQQPADTSPPAFETNDQPAWLSGEASAAEAAAPEERDLPEWLRGASDTSEAEEPANGSQSLPAWLAGLAADEATLAPSEDVASDTSAPSPAPEPAASSDSPPTPPSSFEETDQPSQPGDADIPAWLRDIPSDEIRRVMEGDEEDITIEPFTFEEPSARPADAPAADAPAWLSGISDAAGDESDAGPDWLTGLPDDTPPAPAGAGNAPDLPLWLQDLGNASAQDVPAEPAAPPPGDTTSQSEAGALPGWLEEAAAPQPPPEALPAWLQEQPSSAAPSEDLPAWLQAETPAAPEQQPPAAPASAPDNLPAWLRASTSAEAPAAPAEAAIPDWLRADVTPPPAPAEGQELPPWLSDALTSTPTPEPAHTPPPEPSWRSAPAASPDEELPAWLRDDAPAPPAEEVPPWLQSGARSEPARPEAPTPASEDLPPWLRDDAGQPLPTAGRPGDANLPEWLRGEETFSAESSAQPAPAATPAQTPAAPNLDWFEEDTNAGAAGQMPAAESEFFGGAELPAWLRKADAEPATEISSADARSLDWLTKLGSHEEEIPGTAVASATRSVPLPPAPIRSQAQIQALALLQSLAAEPYPVSAPTPAPVAPPFWRRIGLERLLYVVLLLALLAALTLPDLAAGLQSPPQAPGAAELFERIDALTPNDVVLIGYEWDARRISELKPLEQAVVGQLIQKQVKLVLVSTDPQGSLLLFDLRDDLQAANYKEGGEDYILLGYKPGGDLALRALAQDFQAALHSDFQGSDATISALAGGLQTGRPLMALSDFSMLLVLADEPGDVQSWVEQIHSSVPQTPLAFLLPAESAPLVEPYIQPPRDARSSPIYHLAGRQGALAYEQLRGAQRTPSVQIEREIGQQRLALLVFVALLLLGGVVVGVSGALRRGTT